MGKRTQRAADLEVCLRGSARHDIPSHSYLHEVLAGRRLEARARRRPATGGPSPATDGAGHGMVLHDFQTDFLEVRDDHAARRAPARHAVAVETAQVPAARPR